MGQLIGHISMTKQTILENHVKICQAEKRLSQSRNQTSREKYQQRISCLNNQNGQLESLRGQLEALDVQYASEPGMALAEKSKKFMQGLPRTCN